VSRTEFEIGDIVAFTKNEEKVGYITEVYYSKIKITYKVEWFNHTFIPVTIIEGYFLEKV